MTLAYDDRYATDIRTSTPEVKIDQNFFRDLQKFGKVQDLVTKQVLALKQLSLANNTATLFNEETGETLLVDIQTLQENFRSSGFRLPDNIVCSTCEAACKVLNPSEPGKNDIVTYWEESWVIVDCEKDFFWIRNIMDPAKTEKVRKSEINPYGGYGDVMPKADPQLSSEIASQAYPLTDHEAAKVKALAANLAGKTLRDVKRLTLPSA
ncbi:hypothetical protein C0416_01195 [bacterium]|nr:hypothetical protein [bacterium]